MKILSKGDYYMIHNLHLVLQHIVLVWKFHVEVLGQQHVHIIISFMIIRY